MVFAKKIRSLLLSQLLSQLRADDQYSQHVNTPIHFAHQDWHVNERIFELPFVFSQIEANGNNQRVLEFGCSRSLLALQLAAMGYEVTGIDLRPYPFAHPNFTFTQGNLLEFSPSKLFDYITSISVIEHIGLGAYLEEKREDDLMHIMVKLSSLLKPAGKLIVTTPVGKAHVNKFFRSFAHKEIVNLLTSSGMILETEQFYYRAAPKTWIPCNENQIGQVSNHPDDKAITGVNGVGCFVLRKAAA